MSDQLRLEAAENVFNNAFQKLINYDKQLFGDNLHEQTLCGRLAIYLEEEVKKDDIHKTFPYHADVEYNKMQQGKVKTILNENAVNQKEKYVKVRCDVIVHARGEIFKSYDNQEIDYQKENLIAIEMKKESRGKKELESNQLRLRSLTSKYGENYFSGLKVYSWDGVIADHVRGYLVGKLIRIRKGSKTLVVETYIETEHKYTEFYLLPPPRA